MRTPRSSKQQLHTSGQNTNPSEMLVLNALRSGARLSTASILKSVPSVSRGFGSFAFSSTRPTILGAAPAGLSIPPAIITSVTDTLAPRISASPVLRALQVRSGPRDTFDPSHRVRKRRSGFLARIKTRTGRATLKRRKLKGRKSLSH